MNDVIQHHSEQYMLIGGDSIMNVGKALQAKPRPEKDANLDTSKIKPWGDANNFPQWVLEQIKDVTLVEPILNWKARALYGGGLCYGRSYLEDGEEKIERIIDPKIEQWLYDTDIDAYLRKAANQFYYFYNIFPELILGGRSNRINYISCKDAVNCRYETKNAKGIIKKLYISPDWEAYGAEDDIVEKVDIYNHYYTDVKKWIAKKRDKRFIYPVHAYTPGRAYYHKAPWHVILNNWLPIARAIPEFKKALLKNQVTIKYIVKVPEWWWYWKYKDFQSKSEEERLKIITEEKRNFEEFFTGEKQGNSFIYTQKDSTQAKQYSEWEVIVPDDKLKSATYIEDSQEADAHLFKNLQVDPTLFGNTAGKDRSGAGSGSDKYVAWNNYMIMTKPHQDIILKPLQFVSRWNGWDEILAGEGRFKWWFKNYQIARLGRGIETSETSEQ